MASASAAISTSASTSVSVSTLERVVQFPRSSFEKMSLEEVTDLTASTVENFGKITKRALTDFLGTMPQFFSELKRRNVTITEKGWQAFGESVNGLLHRRVYDDQEELIKTIFSIETVAGRHFGMLLDSHFRPVTLVGPHAKQYLISEDKLPESVARQVVSRAIGFEENLEKHIRFDTYSDEVFEILYAFFSGKAVAGMISIGTVQQLLEYADMHFLAPLRKLCETFVGDEIRKQVEQDKKEESESQIMEPSLKRQRLHAVTEDPKELLLQAAHTLHLQYVQEGTFDLDILKFLCGPFQLSNFDTYLESVQTSGPALKSAPEEALSSSSSASCSSLSSASYSSLSSWSASSLFSGSFSALSSSSSASLSSSSASSSASSSLALSSISSASQQKEVYFSPAIVRLFPPILSAFLSKTETRNVDGFLRKILRYTGNPAYQFLLPLVPELLTRFVRETLGVENVTFSMSEETKTLVVGGVDFVSIYGLGDMQRAEAEAKFNKILRVLRSYPLKDHFSAISLEIPCRLDDDVPEAVSAEGMPPISYAALAASLSSPPPKSFLDSIWGSFLRTSSSASASSASSSSAGSMSHASVSSSQSAARPRVERKKNAQEKYHDYYRAFLENTFTATNVVLFPKKIIFRLHPVDQIVIEGQSVDRTAVATAEEKMIYDSIWTGFVDQHKSKLSELTSFEVGFA